MQTSPGSTRKLAALCFLLLAVVWTGLRFVPVAGTPDVSVRAEIEAVHVEASPESGKLRILGLPPGGASRPGSALEARVAALNSDLARRAARLAGRLEEFEDGTVALRVAGLAVPFHDHDAGRLAHARNTATERPWLALQAIADVIASRLDEPPQGIEIESTVRRRELTRTFREIQDALSAAETDSRTAQESYRMQALAAATPRPDAFRREGRGRLLEAWLAAWLAVTLRAWRRPRGALDLAVVGAAAAIAAVAAVLALEGSPLLPIDERGVTPAFLPLSFAIGWAVAALVERPIRAVRVPEADAAIPAAPGVAPRKPGLREIVRDLRSAQSEPPARPRSPVRPPAPRSEVDVEEDPVVGPGRRTFGPPGGPQPRPPEPTSPALSDPAPTARLPFFRRRRT